MSVVGKIAERRIRGRNETVHLRSILGNRTDVFRSFHHQDSSLHIDTSTFNDPYGIVDYPDHFIVRPDDQLVLDQTKTSVNGKLEQPSRLVATRLAARLIFSREVEMASYVEITGPMQLPVDLNEL